ncbi:MAG: FAD-dependent oxidoreductase [Hyphomicrobiales bacterium]
MTELYRRAAVFQFEYRRSPDQDAETPVRHPVVVVGAGPIGLATAIDLAQRGNRVVLLDDADRIGEGSRGLCYSKRALEILDHLGAGARVVAKGVSWKLGKVFFRDDKVYEFDLLPEAGHKMPAFVNLQQFFLEEYLVERIAELDGIDLRWSNRVTALDNRPDGVGLTIETPDGPYTIETDWLIAADGARSTLRDMVGAQFVGRTFEDQFLIADIRMKADFPPERWFWFEPPFHGGQSTLLHRQPDDTWRIDFQIGADADAQKEQEPDRVRARLDRMLAGRDYSLEWVSVYRFQCRRMADFRHGRVFFAGDAAHQVSPFGARGANSGLEDAENIAWKLDLVIRGAAPESLLATYNLERSAAADMNIGHSTRSTDFISPKGPGAVTLRNAVLDLSRRFDFARRMVNSGRLSTPATYETPLSTPDRDSFAGPARLGAPLPDAPLTDGEGNDVWLLDALGPGFTLIAFSDGTPIAPLEGVTVLAIGAGWSDPQGLLARRLDATPGAAYLVRPDQHLCARFRAFDPDLVRAAIDRARGMTT